MLGRIQIDERTRTNTRYAAANWLQLLLGGVMPTLTLRGALVAYLALCVMITTGCLLVYGWPAADEWASTWLPALLGPALFVGAYSIVARIGHWWVERRIG